VVLLCHIRHVFTVKWKHKTSDEIFCFLQLGTFKMNLRLFRKDMLQNSNIATCHLCVDGFYDFSIRKQFIILVNIVYHRNSFIQQDHNMFVWKFIFISYTVLFFVFNISGYPRFKFCIQYNIIITWLLYIPVTLTFLI